MIKAGKIRWLGHVARKGGKRHSYRMFARKPKGKVPLGRLRCRWEDNIKIARGWGGMDWIDLTRDRDQWRTLVNMVMNLWVP
jgi:hypothetical protein